MSDRSKPISVVPSNISQSSSSKGLSSSSGTDEKKTKRKVDPEWLKNLYDISLFGENELNQIYDAIRFIGFDRDLMLAELQRLIPDHKVAVEAIITCALRGPRKAEEIKLMNGKTLRQMGIPASDQKGTENLSCQRIASSTADLAAYYLKRLNFKGRSNLALPGWLQFPTAGSIKLPENLRAQHKEFNQWFSKTIGGEFNEDIYNQMVQNSYLDENLNLFN